MKLMCYGVHDLFVGPLILLFFGLLVFGLWVSKPEWTALFVLGGGVHVRRKYANSTFHCSPYLMYGWNLDAGDRFLNALKLCISLY